MHPETDEQLMLKVRDGDVERLAVLYERHRTRLLGFFVRLTGSVPSSEDLVHDVFLRMLKYRHTFNADHRFITWMYQVARNAQSDFHRKRQHDAPADLAMPDGNREQSCPAATPDEQVGQEQELELLQRVLAGLPEDLREVLVLSRFQELKYEEIARVLNCGIGAVKMRMHRGLKELRHRFIAATGKELK
ncbi:MAG TPA: RNA polymerase sigma factor [Candidatus Limnocylindria bacterium]|jgi:RNA polymerase sigma-70 factor (ECF subfamily)|nr:RNA polymerase sigma factor [Candidatus Limnocylindria bacterium]